MKTYKVVLTKSYLVRVKEDSKDNAKKYAEFFTGDIQDISTTEFKNQFNFEIESIECTFNEAFDVQEIEI